MDPRRTLFVSERLLGRSGAEAARNAGYKTAGAARQATVLMKDPEILLAIAAGGLFPNAGAKSLQQQTGWR